MDLPKKITMALAGALVACPGVFALTNWEQIQADWRARSAVQSQVQEPTEGLVWVNIYPATIDQFLQITTDHLGACSDGRSLTAWEQMQAEGLVRSAGQLQVHDSTEGFAFVDISAATVGQFLQMSAKGDSPVQFIGGGAMGAQMQRLGVVIQKPFRIENNQL